MAAAGRPGGSRESSRSRGHSADTGEEESVADSGDDEEEARISHESDDEDEFDEDEAMVEDDLDDQPQSLVVKLSLTPPKLRTALTPMGEGANTLPTPDAQDWKVGSSTPDAEREEKPAQESISVIVGTAREGADASRATPHEGRHATPPASDGAVDMKPCDAAVAAAPLAFRGSPEKPHGQPIASSNIDVAGWE